MKPSSVLFVFLLGIQPAYSQSLEEAGAKASAVLQGKGEGEVPPTGPQAAYQFYMESRGERNNVLLGKWYPSGLPIDLSGCKNITQLRMGDGDKDPGLWTRAQIEEDFLKYKAELAKTDPKAADALKGVIVMVKTEYCCQGSRLCAASTAMLEKQGEEALKSFKIYGLQINPQAALFEEYAQNPDSALHEMAKSYSALYGKRTAEQREWERKVIAEYRFQQGPGARWVAFTPGIEGVEATDAQKLKLSAPFFEPTYEKAAENDGQERPVQKWAQGVLDKWDAAKQTPDGAPQSR